MTGEGRLDSCKISNVQRANEKLKESKNYHREDVVLIGEDVGRTIAGYLTPSPIQLKEKVRNKAVIMSTTYGIVAIFKSRHT
ncbi:2-phosphosulfolactate phosphatase [Desertibacillus haloalkaliphilus]|nr:2-phosphosulfolactate phosphatase [Desertibacillus haloalkaliphilus]